MESVIRLGGGGCECGVKADGSCKPCSNPDNQCGYSPVDCTNPPGINYNSYTEAIHWKKANCPIGNAQVWDRRCYNSGAEQICDDWLRTYNCCPSGTQSTCVSTLIGTYVNTQEGSIPGCSAGDTVKTTWVVSSRNTNVWRCENEGTPEEHCGWTDVTLTTYSTRCNNYEPVCSCVSTCTSTAPTNMSVTPGASPTAVTLSWRSGTGGTSQVIYVGTNQTSVNNNCSTGGCIISGSTVSPFLANTN
jgi:hypothetical protein